MVLSSFLIGLVISFQSTFYPFEAEEKGAVPSQYGFVFGVFNLSLFVFSPIFGKYGMSIGVKYLYIGGTFIVGVVTTLFVMLKDLPDPKMFIGLSYILRFLDGLGHAMRFGSGVVLATQWFPNNIATVVSVLDSTYGFGRAIGPPVGVWLYNYGGFKMPFLAGGIATIIQAIIIGQDILVLHQCWPHHAVSNSECEEGAELLPSNMDAEGTDTKKAAESGSEDDNDKNTTLLEILSEPQVCLAAFDMFICSCGYCMIAALLQPHLQLNQISVSDTAIAFLISAFSCIAASFSTGVFYDQFQLPLASSILGNMFNVAYFTFIGPVPGMPIGLTKEMVWGITPLNGMAVGCLMISTFNRMHVKICQMGFVNGTSIISGIWIAAGAFGGFCGPTVAGILVQAVGFPTTSLILLILYTGMLISDITEAIATRSQQIHLTE